MMGLIGQTCKPCEGLSGLVLIGRGLDRKVCSRPLCGSETTNRPLRPRVWGDQAWGVWGGCGRDVSVVDSGGETPGPIPNPVAKPASADGTASGRVWESKTPPDSTRERWRSVFRAGLQRFLCADDATRNEGRTQLGTALSAVWVRRNGAGGRRAGSRCRRPGARRP